MKRMLTLFLVLAMAVSMVACSSSDSTTTATTEAAATEAAAETAAAAAAETTTATELDIPSQQLTIGTASSGGAFYPIGTGIAEVISNHVDALYVTAEITGGSTENVRLVGTGESDLGISNGDHVLEGVEGTGTYTESYDLTAICSLHASVLHIVTTANSGITSIADLKGQKVAVGPAGGGSIPMFEAVLAVYGMTMDDIQASYLSYDDGISQLKDGQVKVALVGAGFPASSVLSLAATDEVVLLSLSDEDMEAISEANPAYTKTVIPADTYDTESDVIVLGVRNLVYCSSELGEDTVYAMTKALYENLDELKTYHSALDDVEQATMCETSGVPLHAGAERYYKEIGLIE